MGADATEPVQSGTEGVVVIPAFNEAARIGSIIDRVRLSAPALDVLVIDDGSSDDTPERAHRHGARVLKHPFNLGYGAALQTGYKYAERASYQMLVQMDADGQHDPADVPRLVAPLRTDTADIVIGSRFAERRGYRMGAARTAGRAFLQRLLVACGGPRVADPTSGFQALRRAAFTFCCADFYPSDFPDVDVLLLLHRAGFRITEIPVTMAPSPPGRVPMHNGLRTLYYPYKMLLSTLRSAGAPRKETR
jgi:glycosyltransferase involved in cell wall biosynthesis